MDYNSAPFYFYLDCLNITLSIDLHRHESCCQPCQCCFGTKELNRRLNTANGNVARNPGDSVAAGVVTVPDS